MAVAEAPYSAGPPADRLGPGMEARGGERGMGEGAAGGDWAEEEGSRLGQETPGPAAGL